MRTLFLTLLFSLVFPAANAVAGDVLVVQGLRVKPFENALAGFRSVFSGSLKTIVLSDNGNVDVLRSARENRPDLILAIGAEALDRVKDIRDIPVIYSMVLNPEKIAGDRRNIAGVSMDIPPERYLTLMEILNPKRAKVGLIYDPSKTGEFVKRILRAAGKMGIEITAMEVHTPGEVPETFVRRKSAFNIFWMLPDSTVVTPETVEFLLLYARENAIPVVTFAGKYLETGALVSLGIDGFDLGKQAGEMARKIIEGADVSELPDADARTAVLTVNRDAAKNLGINPDAIEVPSFSN